jgi:hypothetical protein
MTASTTRRMTRTTGTGQTTTRVLLAGDGGRGRRRRNGRHRSRLRCCRHNGQRWTGLNGQISTSGPTLRGADVYCHLLDDRSAPCFEVIDQRFPILPIYERARSRSRCKAAVGLSEPASSRRSRRSTGALEQNLHRSRGSRVEERPQNAAHPSNRMALLSVRHVASARKDRSDRLIQSEL